MGATAAIHRLNDKLRRIIGSIKVMHPDPSEKGFGNPRTIPIDWRWSRIANAPGSHGAAGFGPSEDNNSAATTFVTPPVGGG